MKLLLALVVITCTTCTYKPVLKYKVQVVSVRKEWASTVTGKRKLYLDHIYNTSK
jgi:hypothetical protein